MTATIHTAAEQRAEIARLKAARLGKDKSEATAKPAPTDYAARLGGFVGAVEVQLVGTENELSFFERVRLARERRLAQ